MTLVETQLVPLCSETTTNLNTGPSSFFQMNFVSGLASMAQMPGDTATISVSTKFLHINFDLVSCRFVSGFIDDVMACRWNIPGDYTPGFDDCEGENVPHPMGECKYQVCGNILIPSPLKLTSSFFLRLVS